MAVNLSPVGGAAAQFFTNSGQVLTGGKIYSYLAGTTTPTATYTTSTGITAQPNPIILNAAGRVPDSGEIWLTDGLSYKFVLKDENDVLIATYDNLLGINSNFLNFTGQEETQTATQGQTIFTLTTLTYQPATNNLLVFINGSKQIISTNFVETSSTVVTFIDGLNVGDVVDFCTATPINTTTVDAGAVSFIGFKSQIGNVQDLADNDGSDWVGFLQAGTNAVAISAQDKMRQIVSVKDFGATGDSTTDDTTAIQNALSYAASINSPVYIPAGTYLLTNAITVSSANRVNIEGAGRRNVQLFWPSTASGFGLNITYTDPLRPPKVTGISFITGASSGGTGLKITGPESASITFLGPYVDDIEACGADTATQTWDVGIEFYTCWYITLSNCSIKGKDQTGPFTMVAGIKLTSCQVCWMSNFTIIHSTSGILEAASGVASHGEGFCFENFEIVGGMDGISLTADGIGPGTNIGPGHINTNRFGIKLANQWQTAIHDLLIYKTQLSVDPYVAIQMYDCNSCHVHDNEIQSSAGPTTDTTGILLTGNTYSDYNNIHDNTFRDFNGTLKVGIILGTGAGNNKIHDNLGDTSLTSMVQVNVDADVQNFIWQNIPSVWPTLTVNSTTPSVGNSVNGNFYTANTSATTITIFNNGYVGQQITVVAGDSNTTIQHNSALILKGSVDFVMAAGNTLTLIKDTNLWREISRTS